MTRDELKAMFADELRGIVMEAYCENYLAEKATKPGIADAAKGRMIMASFRKAAALLDRILLAAIPDPPKAVPNGQTAVKR